MSELPKFGLRKLFGIRFQFFNGRDSFPQPLSLCFMAFGLGPISNFESG